MLNFFPKLFSRSQGKDANSVVSSAQQRKMNSSKLKEALLLMSDRPDGVADISNCSLENVPKEFFELCVTYVKVKVICSNNHLKNLDGGGNIGTLCRVIFFDVSFNRLEKLPISFGFNFPSLVELNLRDNLLGDLPDSMTHLKTLRILKVANNRFVELPVIVCEITSLVELDITGNDIRTLPVTMGKLVHLKIFSCSVEHLIYPAKEICESGTSEILKKLCTDGGYEFNPHVYTEITGVFPVFSKNATDLSAYGEEEKRMQNAISRMKSDEALKNKEMMRVYSEIEEDHRRLSESIAKSKEKEQQVVLQSLRERTAMELDLLRIVQNVEVGQKHLAETVREMESHSEQLLTYLSQLSENRARNLKSYEEDCREFDRSWHESYSKFETIRKEQVVDALKAQLDDDRKFTIFFKDLMDINRCDLENIINQHRSEETKLIPLIERAKIEQENIINSMLHDENVQREMFRELQLKIDSSHQSICKDISLLESELMVLSLLEQNRTEDQAVIIKKTLEDDRLRLTELYRRLLLEKKERELHLLNVMREMEADAQRHLENFWLLQYSHLMETIPPSLTSNDSVPAAAVPAKLKGDLEKGVTYSTDTSVAEKSVFVDSPTTPGFPKVLRLENICIVCMDKQSSEIFLPCGHVCCCDVCGPKLLDCPLCRVKISEHAKLSKSDDYL